MVKFKTESKYLRNLSECSRNTDLVKGQTAKATNSHRNIYRYTVTQRKGQIQTLRQQDRHIRDVIIR